MTVRRAETRDAAAMERIALASYAPYLARMDRAPAPMSADYAAHVDRDWAIVCEDGGGRVAGYAIVRETGEGWMLENIGVDPAMQGKGLGRLLVEDVERYLRSRGADAYALYTHETMVENIDWYTRLGFVETGRVEEDGFRRVYMRKALTGAL